MLELLRAHDAGVVEVPCGAGSVLLPPTMAGRIFCQWRGELVHRLDGASLQAPSTTAYNNYGGNALWPAPEGGRFAFNYGVGNDAWVVQEGIASAVPSIQRQGDDSALIRKSIHLANRKGLTLHLDYIRELRVHEPELPAGRYAIEGMAYATVDTFAPLGDYDADEVLLAPWSLEQYPGAEGIIAFGKLANRSPELNLDFYSDPSARIVRNEGQFTFALGGEERHQIGIPVATGPTLLGALDPHRGFLFLRTCAAQEGRYFNIADNDQKDGPFSAADLYSIFNGGELGFFELETIGAMQVEGGRLAKSSLHSETVILQGNVDELLRYLSEEKGVTFSLG
jgi:hypothetical protein